MNGIQGQINNTRLKKTQFNYVNFVRKAQQHAAETRSAYHEYMGALAALNQDKVFFILFEHLFNAETTVRLESLSRLVRFVAGPGFKYSKSDLEKAFASAEVWHRPAPASDEISFEEAVDNDVAHQYWNALGPAAETVIGASYSVSIVQKDFCDKPAIASAFKFRWHPPAILYSIPGSGNTMVRLMLDSIFAPRLTSSLYYDWALFKNLPGEAVCTPWSSAIKAHPHMTRAIPLFALGRNITGHCGRCIHRSFKAAIVITRHPMRAFFAEYNRMQTKIHAHTHNGRISRKNFNRTDFEIAAVAHAAQVKRIFYREYAYLVQYLPAGHVIFVQFEELTSKDKVVRFNALRRLIAFLTVPGTEVPDEVLEKAFASAQSVHRPPPKPFQITFEESFTRELKCKFWAVLRNSTRELGGYSAPPVCYLPKS